MIFTESNSIRLRLSKLNLTTIVEPRPSKSNILRKGSNNRGGLKLKVIFSMIKSFLFNKTWSDNGGGLIPGGLIPEVPLYYYYYY